MKRCCCGKAKAEHREATSRVRHETAAAAVSRPPPLRPASRPHPVASGSGNRGRPHLAGGAPHGGRPQGRFAGGAGGRGRWGAPPAPSLPRAQLPLSDRHQGRCLWRIQLLQDKQCRWLGKRWSRDYDPGYHCR